MTHTHDCCDACKAGEPCETDCDANPVLLAQLIRTLVGVSVPAPERKRYVLEVEAGAAAADARILETAQRPGWRPVVEDFWMVALAGGGGPATIPHAVSLAAVRRDVTLPVAIAGTQLQRPIIPIGTTATSLVSAGCVYLPQAIEVDGGDGQYWKLFASLGIDGGGAARMEIQVAWVPIQYAPRTLWDGGVR